MDQGAIFAENQLSVTPKLKLVGGLRFDWIDATFTRTDLGAVSAPTAPVTAEKSWSPVGTRVGAVFDVVPSVTLYGQHTTATEAVGTLLLLTQANADFELTKGRMFEFGVKSDFWGGRGELTAAVYRIVKESVLVPITPTLSVQAGQQSRKAWSSPAVRPVRTLKLEANAALLKAEFDSFSEVVGGQLVSRDGNRPQNVPEQVFNAGARYAVVPELEIGAWARYVGKRYTNTASTIEMPAYTVIDPSAQYRMSRATSLQLWVRNVTDRLYAQYRGASNNQVILGADRSFELVMRTSF